MLLPWHRTTRPCMQHRGRAGDLSGVTCMRVRPARCGVPFTVSLLQEAMRSSVSVVSCPMLASACKSSSVEKWPRMQCTGHSF